MANDAFLVESRREGGPARALGDTTSDVAERGIDRDFGEVVVEGTRTEVVAHPRTREIYLGE